MKLECLGECMPDHLVTLCVRVWIEITQDAVMWRYSSSHPLREGVD